MKSLLRRKSFVLAAACAATFMFYGCSGSKESAVKTIGISQIVEHPALDDSRSGFIDALADAGFVDGENIKIDYQNAQGDQSNLKTISQKFVENKVDLIHAIATPSAQSVASETKTIPIIISAVTDPEAAGLVESNQKPNTNVTGASDLTPVGKQIDRIKEVFPDAKAVGVIYNSSEINSEIQANMAKEKAEELGLECKIATVASANDIPQVAEALVAEVDVIYAPTDNLIVSSMPVLAKVATENKIPIITGEEGACANGGLMSDSINYYNLGKLAGEMAVKVLKGEDTPQNMPIQYLENTTLFINPEVAEELGVTFPASILSEAQTIQITGDE